MRKNALSTPFAQRSGIPPGRLEGLSEGQKALVRAAVCGPLRCTLALGPGGTGKTWATRVAASLWEGSGGVILTAWTANAAKDLDATVDASVARATPSLTVLALLQHYKKYVRLTDETAHTFLVIVDEACMIPVGGSGERRAFDAFWDIFGRCTVLLLGDPDQTGPIDGVSLWQPGTRFRSMIDDQVGGGDAFANIVWLTEMKRIVATDEASREYADIIVRVSRGEDGALADFAEWLHGAAARSKSTDLTGRSTQVAVPRRLQALEGNNRSVRLAAKPGDVVVRLVERAPVRASGPAWLVRELLCGGRARVEQNEISAAWRRRQPSFAARVRGEGKPASERVYTVANYQLVEFRSWVAAPAKRRAKRPKTERNERRTLGADPRRPPFRDGVVVEEHVVKSGDAAEALRDDGTSVTVAVRQNDKAANAPFMPLTACIEGQPEFATIHKYQGKTVPPDTTFVISVQDWRSMSFCEVYMLATRSADPARRLKFFPRPPPGFFFGLIRSYPSDLRKFKQLTQPKPNL